MSVYRKIGLVAFAILCIVVTGFATSLPDEMVVRSSYAKVSMAFEIDQLQSVLMRNQNRPAGSEHLHVNISDLRLGPIQDILNTPLDNLVTKPSGYVLDASLHMAEIPGNDKRIGPKFMAIKTAGWKVAPYISENWHVPFSELVNSMDVTYSRYANFRITLTFMGQQKNYSALFLFGTGRNGEPQMFAIDHILGVSIINGLLGEPIEAQVKTIQQEFGSRAAVKRFLQSVQPQAGCKVDTGSQLCCNPATGQCGVSGLAPVDAAPESLLLGTFPSTSSLSLQSSATTNETCTASCTAYNNSFDESSPKNAGAQDSTQHYTGMHSGSVSFQGQCTYNTGSPFPCIPYCHVHVLAPSTTDTGVWTSWCHSTSAGSNFTDGQNSCTGGAGWAAAACPFCACGVSVSVTANGGAGSVTVSGVGSAIWTPQPVPHSWSCPTIN